MNLPHLIDVILDGNAEGLFGFVQAGCAGIE
ncbi:hypothetical protein SAMN05519105_3533 [Rhodobacter sp. 24-YEA-8]|nr:hypothetical protein SAMN05519105_3533 [Rhodobacter sp. 24-YEA-8]